MVTYRDQTVDRKILTMVRHCSFSMCWPPLMSKDGETPSLPRPGNERQQNVNDLWYCIMGNLSGNWLQTVINEVLASIIGKRGSDMLPAPS